MENTTLLIALAAGAYYFLSTSKGKPVFRDANGNIITQMTCGNSMTFDVSGYKQVYLSQLKNGVTSYEGVFNLPMQPYIASCSMDVGTYDMTVYEANPDGSKGALIGTTMFVILPQTQA
jgi:hypothetical protein